MEIHPSARRHGAGDADSEHAYVHALGWVEIGEDPRRYLLAGPDRAGNVLELVVLVTEQVTLVIHAMKLRRSSAAAIFGEDL